MTHTLKFILALLLLVGCQNEPIELDDNRPNPDGSIGFRLKLADSSIGSDSSKTKGTPHDDLAKYDSVCVKVYSHTADYETSDDVAFFQKVTLKPGTPNWVYTPPMFWPTGKKLSFMAYASDLAFLDAGISFMPATGVPDSIKYEVPSEVTKQPDLLVSAKLNEEENANKITLDMKHALACISFIGTSPDPGTYVKKIKLRNVYGKGTLALNDDTIVWKIDTDSKDFTVFEAGIKDTSELKDPPANNLMTANGYLMMIPQELTDAAIDVFYWDGTNETKSITYLLPTNDPSYATWKAGKKYIYKFSTQSEADITVVYYEKYAGEKYGFQSKTPISLPGLNNTDEIIEAGYGVLTKGTASSDTPNISIGTNGKPIVSKKITTEGYNLYAVNQTSIDTSATFELPATPDPVDVYFDDSDEACGKIIPHFAKGVSDSDPTDYAIRTPQQMRNISALTIPEPFGTNSTPNKTFEQERDLDFSKEDIGGGSTLSQAVVDHTFSGTYNGKTKSISNLTILAPDVSSVGLFSENVGVLNDITLKASSITGREQVGGIAGKSWGSNGAINRPRVIGTKNAPTTVKGDSHIGGIAGVNQGKITGNTAIDPATKITVAEVSGYVSITGTGDFVGGIAGKNIFGNDGSINTVLVYGVYVKGVNETDVEPSLITISGINYVGGITGDNEIEIKGNVTGAGENIKNMPDVAGIVKISGTGWVGGIAGRNNAYGGATGELNSVNVRLGRSQGPLIIEGKGGYIGGIVGQNLGKMGTTTNTFISVRGNIQISGTQNIGGIVGFNSSKATLQNCFVYDYFSRTGTTQYFAPIITASIGNVGGIAGSNEAEITNCSVFSSDSSATLKISSTGSGIGSGNAGGIVGVNQTMTNVTNKKCSVVGKVEIKTETEHAGGIIGDNGGATTITNCWIGSSDGYNIITNAETDLGLIISPNPSYGTPTVTGDEYIGGIAGLNAGKIDGIELSDNVTIGRLYVKGAELDGSNYVGGIVGGNTTAGEVVGCKVVNADNKIATIRGSRSLGGIVGLNNGVVDNCHVTASSLNSQLTINGLGTIGGIVGQNGGHDLIKIKDPSDPNKLISGTGNDETMVTNCTVNGYVTIQGHTGFDTATEVGGIIGLNGPTKDDIKNVFNCTVTGAANTNSIVITVGKNAGGIAGTNGGNIEKCSVKNATIYSTSTTDTLSYAGGIAGQTSATDEKFNPEKGYRSNINGCTVSSGVTIKGPNIKSTSLRITAPGALVGFIDAAKPIVFGATTNKVSSEGVSVNDTPITSATPLDKIVGYATNGATIKYETVP